MTTSSRSISKVLNSQNFFYLRHFPPRHQYQELITHLKGYTVKVPLWYQMVAGALYPTESLGSGERLALSAVSYGFPTQMSLQLSEDPQSVRRDWVGNKSKTGSVTK